MPNTGMLDHIAFKPRSKRRSCYVHWMGAWPSSAGYQTMRSLKVSNFSRHLIGQNQKQQQQLRMSMSRPSSSIPRIAIGNSISPFHTSMKPTCGWFFSHETCHRKSKIGIPPSNLVAWRSSSHSAPPSARARTA